MRIPTIQFISEVENVFSVCYPESFKTFCHEYASKDIVLTYPKITEGQFIHNVETLKTVNTRIGHEQWADYENAIAGNVHPKRGDRLWGDLLPIYVHGNCIYGFYVQEPTDENVYVWSVHSVVHAYPNLKR